MHFSFHFPALPKVGMRIFKTLGAVLLVPPLEPLFQVAQLSASLVGTIVGLAFGSMVVIQILKAIRNFGK